MGPSPSFRGENPPWHYRAPTHRKTTIKAASGAFRRWREIRSKEDILPHSSGGEALLDKTLSVGPGLNTIDKPSPPDTRRSSQIPVQVPDESGAAEAIRNQYPVSRWPAPHNDFSRPPLESEPFKNTPPSSLLCYMPQDDDLEDLACLDAAISREENHVPVQQRLQALEANLCWMESSEVSKRFVASQYFRDLDEKIYMSHVSDTNYWGAVRDDPIFAPIITEPSPVSVQQLHQNIGNSLTAEADTWCDLIVDRETDTDSVSQASVTISESDGESPSPKTQSVNSDEFPEQNRRPPTLKPRGTPLKAPTISSNTILQTYLDHTQAEQYRSFDNYVPTLQFISSDTAIPDKPHHNASFQPPSILAVENLFMAATRRETISPLQYTTPEQYGDLAATYISILPTIPGPNHAIIPHKTNSMPNIHERLKSPAKQGRTHSVPTLPTTPPSTTSAKSPAIKINLKVTQPNPGSQFERCSDNTSPRAKANATKTKQPSHRTKDRQQKSTEKDCDQNRSMPPPSPSPSSITEAIKAKYDKQPSPASLHTHKSPTHENDNDSGSHKLSPQAPTGRSLRPNPTPSRKRRYSEFEHAQKLTPASASGGHGRGYPDRGGAGGR